MQEIILFAKFIFYFSSVALCSWQRKFRRLLLLLLLSLLL